MAKSDSPSSWEELFAQLSVSERLELVRVVLSGIEKEIVPPTARGPVGIAETPQRAESPRTTQSSKDALLEQGFAEYDPAPFVSGIEAPIHRQRLEDAVSHLRGLLKKYGYVKGLPATSELARLAQDQLAAEDRRRVDSGRRPEWAEWVAKSDDPEDGD